MTVDYRALNWWTKKYEYPHPWIDDLLDKLSCANFFSAIDLASGYHQIRLAPEDCEKTTFVTRYGLFKYRFSTWVVQCTYYILTSDEFCNVGLH